ncbi:hypothetical protein M501DRAFT_1020484 [Patellaria atrata CBS 101060]|uniref:Uncharacterized protein n=1 Tax=Patellaria atrata CBS 101060 TaxID=1346257 RepID=A0A9P4VJ16_9PEZI|nr:hypothetical protein M501DRAFT_1020484 [Patellaria atrata CBS 101060]
MARSSGSSLREQAIHQRSIGASPFVYWAMNIQEKLSTPLWAPLISADGKEKEWFVIYRLEYATVGKYIWEHVIANNTTWLPNEVAIFPEDKTKSPRKGDRLSVRAPHPIEIQTLEERMEETEKQECDRLLVGPVLDEDDWLWVENIMAWSS